MMPVLAAALSFAVIAVAWRVARRVRVGQRARVRRGGGQHVYIIARTDKCGRAIGPTKVGIAKDPQRRLKTFQTANPRKLILYETFRVSRARALEGAVHRHLRPFRMTGEWFAIPPERAATAVHRVMRRRRGPR